jgi:hypothetical protein
MRLFPAQTPSRIDPRQTIQFAPTLERTPVLITQMHLLFQNPGD